MKLHDILKNIASGYKLSGEDVPGHVLQNNKNNRTYHHMPALVMQNWLESSTVGKNILPI